MTCTLVNETCPAAVSTVTLVSNVFNLGDGDATFTTVTLGSGVASSFILPSLPAANTLQIYKNGQVLVEGEGADFTRSDDTITLTVATTLEDVIVYRYLPQPA